MKKIKYLLILSLLVGAWFPIHAQENEGQLKLSGSLQTDQRILLKSPNDWAWNENRLSMKLEKKIKGNAKFYSEVWLRNIGLPNIAQSSDLYNKNILDPWNLEIREAYVEIYGLFSKNLDVKIGRQRIAWGKADKFNPTDNLNPYDFEDILDFGRHRGSNAVTMNYYLGPNYSLQGVFVPFFQPDNLPIGMFANLFSMNMELPQGLTLRSFTDQVSTPLYNLRKSSTVGLKLKGFARGIDFSFSYLWGHDGLPFDAYNTLIPVDTQGGVAVNAQLYFPRTHIFGFDFATSLGGVGLWGESAVFLPEHRQVMTTDVSALYPTSPVPVLKDSVMLDKKPYAKFVLDADYSFANNSYLNIQYLHGFVNERGSKNLNDYVVLRYEMKFFGDKLKVAPLSGGAVVTDWKYIKNNYAIFYVPQITYMATDNVELDLSAGIFGGEGDNLFAKLSNFNILMFKMKYSF